MIRVLQANCRASEDIMTALMSAAVRAGAGVVLIQEPSMKREKEGDGWIAKIRDNNFIYIHGNSEERPYVLTAIRKDLLWNDYGGERSAGRVGIEIAGTRVLNIYNHGDKVLDIESIRDELQVDRYKRWVCAGDFNSHHSL
jgi:hypothetical protein